MERIVAKPVARFTKLVELEGGALIEVRIHLAVQVSGCILDAEARAIEASLSGVRTQLQLQLCLGMNLDIIVGLVYQMAKSQVDCVRIW